MKLHNEIRYVEVRYCKVQEDASCTKIFAFSFKFHFYDIKKILDIQNINCLYRLSPILREEDSSQYDDTNEENCRNYICSQRLFLPALHDGVQFYFLL